MKIGWSRSFSVGAVAFVFLVIGYQVAVFVHKAAIAKIVADDVPEACVGGGLTNEAAVPFERGCKGASCTGGSSGNVGGGVSSVGGGFRHSEYGGGASCTPDGGVYRARSNVSQASYREQSPDERKQEIRQEIKRNFTPCKEFHFNPNTASLDDFILLGFTEKQAQSIVNYRDKGGRFYRKSDFAKSFVVSDETFARLEPYIDIPLLDINAADSAAFDALPGIGGYFAKKMVEYRARLGGMYSSTEQLLEIYNFGQDRYDRLKDLICIGSSTPLPVFRLWSAPEDSLKTHPYIASWKTAHAIQVYKSVTPRSDWSLDGLVSAGILSGDIADKLSRYYILE